MIKSVRAAMIPIRPVRAGSDEELTASRYEKQAKIYPRAVSGWFALLTVSTLFVVSLSMRSGLTVNVIRDRSTLARVLEDGGVENVYRLEIANGTEQPRRYWVSVSGLPGLKIVTPAEIDIEGTRIGETCCHGREMRAAPSTKDMVMQFPEFFEATPRFVSRDSLRRRYLNGQRI